MKRRLLLQLVASSVALSLSSAAFAHDHGAAVSEGKVVIYTSTDLSQSGDLVAAFEAKYPGVKVEYTDLGSNGTYNRTISEAAANQMGGDVIWSSAMDLQMKLYADGLFAEYESSQAGALPGWANYKNTAYGTSLEPIGMIYNTIAINENELPGTRAELQAMIEKDARMKGKVAAFDPEKSGTGFLFHTNDVRNSDNFWDIAKAFGAAGGKTYSSSGSMRESVVSGENNLAFSIIGSYALDWAEENETLGVAFFSDTNSAFSRIMAITKDAPHPNAARLFLDFTLSKEGQEALAGQGLPSVRADTEVGLNATNLADRIGGKVVPIAIDEGLIEYLNPTKRVGFLRKWKAAIAK